MAALQDSSVQCGVHQLMDGHKTLSGVSSYYYFILRLICFFHFVDSYIDVTIAVTGKLLGNLEAANSANSHCIFHLQPLIMENMFSRHKDHLKQNTLSTLPKSVLDEMRSMHKALLLYIEFR